MLSDNQIDDLCCEWLYVAPGRTYEEHRPFARAIESAATAPLLARIAELEAANEAFGKRQEWWNARMLELEQQLEEARKDAERYRFIRDKAQWLDGVPQAIIWRNDGHAQEICAEDELDEAIDAAMKEQT